MGPGYWCETCEFNPDNDRYRDKENGCPRCPLVENFTRIRVENAARLIEKGGYPEGHGIDTLINLHTVVSGILHENEDRIDPRWSTTFASLCRIIQQEESKIKWTQEWTTWKRMQST